MSQSEKFQKVNIRDLFLNGSGSLEIWGGLRVFGKSIANRPLNPAQIPWWRLPIDSKFH